MEVHSSGIRRAIARWGVKEDFIPNNQAKVLLIDDVLATGGTIGAAIELMHRLGAQVTHVLALIEIEGLPGRARLAEKYPNIPVTSLVVS